MRLATAADGILPLKDPHVQSNQGYLIIILLSRVITQLGTVSHINPKVIENLYTQDLAYLQDFYNTINGTGKAHISSSSVTFRLLVDMASMDDSQAIHATGQSGHPYHPNYADMIEMWQNGGYLHVWFSRDALSQEFLPVLIQMEDKTCGITKIQFLMWL